MLDAQRRRPRPRRRSARQPSKAAPIDLTGYWVSAIIEDWKYRMVTPKKGVFDAVPLNAEGRKVGESWDPAKDEAAGEQCRAYGAGGIMRLPGRLHITWQDDTTLKVETDAGTQTRLLRFGNPPAPSRGRPGRDTRWRSGTPRRATSRSSRRTCVPATCARTARRTASKATVTEYWDLNAMPNGDRWLTVTTKVEDPQYFTRPYTTSSDFKKLPDATGWNPTPCSAR